jgi:hypothetical protein
MTFSLKVAFGAKSATCAAFISDVAPNATFIAFDGERRS